MIFTCRYKGRAHDGWWAVECQSRKLTKKIFNVKCKAERADKLGVRGRRELSKPIPSAGLPPEGLRLLKVKKLPPNRANWESRVIYTSLWETCFFGATRISHAIFETSLCKTLLFI